MHFVVTRHATVRAKERIGWRASSLCRMLNRIYFGGVGIGTPGRVPCSLRRYLEQSGRVARAFGEHVFLFDYNSAKDELILVTVLNLPHELRAAVRKAIQTVSGE